MKIHQVVFLSVRQENAAFANLVVSFNYKQFSA